MLRLAICSRDLHCQWINWAPLYDTMEVSMLRPTLLTVAQHVFQPALTGRLELILRKIVSCELGTKAIAVSRFREKLSPANWVQGATAISRKISRSWAPKNGVQHATAIYPIPRYTGPRYIGLTLYLYCINNRDATVLHWNIHMVSLRNVFHKYWRCQTYVYIIILYCEVTLNQICFFFFHRAQQAVTGDTKLFEEGALGKTPDG